MKQTIPLPFLAEYIKNEEVGYQVVDELVNIARGGQHEGTAFLMNELSEAHEATVVEKKDYLKNSGFEAIADWCEPTDVMVLLDTNVMLLFPKHKDPEYPTFSKLIKQFVA